MTWTPSNPHASWSRDALQLEYQRLAEGRVTRAAMATAPSRERRALADITAEQRHRATITACEFTAAAPYDEIDPGIRQVVWILRRWGFNTTDSGDGVSKAAELRAVEGPHVFIRTAPSRLLTDADLLWRRLAGIEGVSVEASYDPANRVALVGVYGLDDTGLAQANAGRGGA